MERIAGGADGPFSVHRRPLLAVVADFPGFPLIAQPFGAVAVCP